MSFISELKIPRSVYLWILVIVVGVLGSGGLIYKFIEDERSRNQFAWQVRLGIVADSRRADVEEWLDNQYQVLTDLAQNSSLQFYAMDILSAMEEGRSSPSQDKTAQAEAKYLLSLLTVTAENAGFADEKKSTADVNANVAQVGLSGLALLDMKGRVLVATRNMPPIAGWLEEEIEKLPKAKRGLIDLHNGVSGTPTMGFTVPIFSVQGNSVATDQVGMIVGIKEVGDELYPNLKQPGNVDQSAEALLVRLEGAVIEYLSPRQDGTPPLKNNLTADSPDLASAFAINTPGGFGEKRDYLNNAVLVVSRDIATVPWTLLYKIDRNEALEATESRLRTVLIVSTVALCFFVAVIIAVWRYGASVRSEQAMESYRETSLKFENILKFMRVITDNQPTEIFAVTEHGEYTFANLTASENAGTTAQDMMGKSMTSVVGPIKAKLYSETNKDVIENFEPAHRVYRSGENEDLQVIRASHLPLRADDNYPRGALVVADDITEFVAEQEARRAGMRQLSRALILLLDQKDPYSTIHAVIVSRIAVLVAEELGLDDDQKLTIDMAGNLVNLGKAFVSSELLNADEVISKEDRAKIREHMLVAADIVKTVNFGVPVVDTLRQLKECWDGSGLPAGISGDAILISARIVGVTNSLIGMLSPRSYRAPLKFEEAMVNLQTNAEARFGPNVVAALFHVMENRGGKEILGMISALDGRLPSPDEAVQLIQDISET